MTEPALIARQRTLLHELTRAAAERAAAEPGLEETHRVRRDEARREFDEANRAVIDRFDADKEEADRIVHEARESLRARFEAEQTADLEQYEAGKKEVEEQYETDKEAARAAFQELRWTIAAVLEGSKSTAEEQFREETARLVPKRARLEAIRQQARKVLEGWNQPPHLLQAPAPPPTPPPGEPEGEHSKLRKLPRCLADAEQQLLDLQYLVAPRLLQGKRLFVLAMLLWAALVYPLGWLLAHTTSLTRSQTGLLALGVACSTFVTLLAATVARTVLVSLARSQVRAAAEPLAQSLVDAEARCRLIVDTFTERRLRDVEAARKKHNADLHDAHLHYKQQARAIQQRHDEALPRLQARYETARQDSAKRHADDVRAAEERHEQTCAAIQQRFETDSQELEEQHRARLAEIDTEYARQWNAVAGNWKRTLARVKAEVAAINGEATRLFPAWDSEAWKDWRPGADLPQVLRFGDYAVGKDLVPHAVPADARLRDAVPPDFTLPALTPFPEHYSMLYQAGDEGRDRAVESVQAVLFRLLTTLPPGKVRFTILDPVGLGQNFATFMNLADYDDLLVTSRIWTETAHIEQRLADLTAHMENVIQKYLRNHYPTIADYNAEAGEVAEPFRVLVVANFPVHFTEEATRRLLSIVQSGPRCGVSTLITVDKRQPLPKGFNLADLERACVNLVWDGGRFRWQDPDFGPYPLRLESPPEDGLANTLLRRVGELAREARRVEVPFEFIAPAPEEWWSGDSRSGLSVALGRAGATKRQYLRLGQGTSQHVLVAGKTGSGKSTLLHALVVNLALTYSPDEVELYLVDFKKGVEFKTYAVHELPHARVVAIESEREFGLSVLQRLDAELRQRGERFREAGAQDLASYRTARPDAHAPRILLIVDEFQEFFVEDDRIAQEAAQLLDRLVRQGRAFGLHVLLGSQTLGGAYSLARSTIDQMAVRVALQCSEADAQLILSADNSAARLLSRPGEAIYNDANGLVEGNSPFQVVWLGEARREEYLARIHALAQQRPLPPLHTVVFEGNAPADVSKNAPLRHLVRTPAPAGADGRASKRTYEAWLGEAMAIQGQTSATFRRQNGSSLVIVGQHEETALGILSTALISLAAQVPSESAPPVASFYVVDGMHADVPDSGLLSGLPDLLPQAVRLTGWRGLPALITELSAEVERRQKAADTEAPPVFVVLYALQRLRDLRRAEDDFGFMRKGDEAPSPAQQFADLLREGPALGVHVLMWCDTLTNLQRAVDRQGMREVLLRVLLQMNVADSSNLADSPQASRLGLHRALLCSEEEGRLEKFRPYGLPPEDWLAWVKQQLAGRASAVGSGT